MEARPTATLSDVTPTGSRTQVITPDEIPEQVNHSSLDNTKKKQSQSFGKNL